MQVANIKLDTTALDRIAQGLGMNTDQALNAISYRVLGYAIERCPRDPTRPPKDPTQPVSGALKGSLEVEEKGNHVYWVQDGVEYGIYLELGTYKMIARPFLRPAVEKVRLDMWKDFRAYLFGGGAMF